jgi:hypothetical protein
VSVGAKQLGQPIARQFFAEDVGAHFDRLCAYDTPEQQSGNFAAAETLPDWQHSVTAGLAKSLRRNDQVLATRRVSSNLLCLKGLLSGGLPSCIMGIE